ncbi:hypothetical protein PHYBOEH_002783 [Phytophthora boehmeriae]|uniref:RxLR effector protein n=1 Tax=Phytophthora boehmeriae TaxID=109152 RepID=A0A8T1V6Z2_9STRA|nr:hypothetical protein PHYBOEH_002783 [Phytophthora boehmeriae]
MRLHYILLVAVATLVASSDLVSAKTTTAQTKLSVVTDSAPAARQLAGALTLSVADEYGGGANKQSLRSVETTDEDDEERGIFELFKEALAKSKKALIPKKEKTPITKKENALTTNKEEALITKKETSMVTKKKKRTMPMEDALIRSYFVNGRPGDVDDYLKQLKSRKHLRN